MSSLLLANRGLIKSAGVPRAGLIGEWLFAGNANDTSGFGNHGTVTGATLTTDRKSQANSAYLFANASVDNILLNSALNEQLTISYSWWINLNTIVDNGSYWFFSNGGVINRNYFAYFFNSSSPGNDVIRHNSGDGSTQMDMGDNPIITGNWYHLVLIRNGTNLSLYLDTFKFTDKTIGGTTLSDTQYFGIRNDQGSLVNGMLGKLDDVRIYNRVLTEIEINALFNE